MPESVETQSQYEGIKISLQGELILDWLEENGIENTTENKILWIDKYSKKYREVINASPQLIQEYLENKESAKEKIKASLYIETIH